jgi:hypothetical protein
MASLAIKRAPKYFCRHRIEIVITRMMMTITNSSPTKILAAKSQAKYLSKKDVFAEATANKTNKVSANKIIRPTKNGFAKSFIMGSPH